MTASALEADGLSGAATALPEGVRWRILGYLGVVLILAGFGSPTGGLIGLPISFFLKNKLHLKAHELATFGLISHIPVYVSFVIGFARDKWNIFGMGDRGLMIAFGGACSVIYFVFAFVAPTYGVLLAASMLLMTSALFIGAAFRGLTATLANQHVMTGQASAVWNIVDSVLGMTTLIAGGMLSDMLEGAKAVEGARTLFLTGAAIMATLALYALWRPRVVYDNLQQERLTSVHPLEDLRRLLRHWPAYLALMIWLLWNFAPGSATPLQYYLQNTLHASDADWGLWNAIFTGAFVPTFALYGVLCRRYALKPLLWWGTILGVPQFIPLLFVHSITGALIAAAPIGLMGGLASAAYLDLVMRSCPPGLRGTLMMAVAALYSVDVRFGDLLGTTLYDKYGGFTVCVIAITVVYALILPVLLLIPKDLISTRDGETATAS